MRKNVKEFIKQIEQINNNFYRSYDFMQTSSCGRGQRHPHGLVGHLWRINNPDSVKMGNCFLEGRLKKGDLFLCVGHSGDFFQTYIYVKEYANCLVVESEWRFGSYGIGNSEKINLTDEEFNKLKTDGRLERK